MILANNQAIVLYKINGALYCSDANSTAFKFPLSNAEILQRETRFYTPEPHKT